MDRILRWGKRALLIAIAAMIACFGVLEGIIFSGSRTRIQNEPQAIIILGAMVWASGPSPVLVNRMDAALEYWRAHPDLPIVVSGAQGSNEPMSEAQAMADYLTAAGVPPEQILREDGSYNTAQNLRNSRALLEARGYDMDETTVLIVSSDFHLARVRLLAGRYGLRADTLAAPMPDVKSAVYSWLREAPAYVKSLLLD